MDDFKVPTLPTTKAENEDMQVENSVVETTSMEPDDVRPPALAKSPVKETASSNCPYKVPPWSAPPPPVAHYNFEVLKSGQIIEEVKNLERQASWIFGRLPENDITMAHPTISRFHAVLQYRPKVFNNNEVDSAEKSTTEAKAEPPEGWYIYDLDSTHGTFLNKQRVPSRVFIRMRVGHMLKLGASTRSYILQGPTEDEEPESELSISELRAQRQQQVEQAAEEAKRKAVEAVERERNEGISWGMGDDADEETDLSHNPFASSNNEELFLDDPKRTLRGYFEREGLTLEYKCDELSVGSFVCRVELPLDDANGRPLIAEVVHKGRKKECVVQCALEACRILDRHGVLRQANQEPLKRKLKSKQSDNSDEDEFWDRTGDVERKKLRKSNASTNVTLTYEDLLKQETELVLQLQKVEDEILEFQKTQKRLKATKAQQEEDGEDLDSFMENLNDGVPQLDKTEIRKLRLDQQLLKAEQQKLQRLIKIAKPIEFTFGETTETLNACAKVVGSTESSKKQLPLIGKRNQFSKFKVAKMPITNITKATSTTIVNKNALASDEEEIEDEQQPPSERILKAENVKITDTRNDGKEDEVKTTETNDLSPSNTIAKQKERVLSHTSELDDSSTSTEIEIPSLASNDDAKVSNTADYAAENAAAKNKRRQRQRQRYKRQEVDNEELEEHESSEKYAKWVPPENQSGDGYTELNKKYGY